MTKFSISNSQIFHNIESLDGTFGMRSMRAYQRPSAYKLPFARSRFRETTGQPRYSESTIDFYLTYGIGSSHPRKRIQLDHQRAERRRGELLQKQYDEVALTRKELRELAMLNQNCDARISQELAPQVMRAQTLLERAKKHAQRNS